MNNQNREYISVSEYAEIFGLSKQAVYKKFKQVVQPVVQLESTGCSTDSTGVKPGKAVKMLRISALSENERSKVESWLNEKLNEVVQPVVQLDGEVVQPDSTTVNQFETVIALLKDQLTQKDAEIERLRGDLEQLRREKDAEIDQARTERDSWREQLQGQIDALTKLLDQQQQLHARTVQALPDGNRRRFFDLFRRKPANQAEEKKV
jgi:predicted RNase H-like nuclease (RuvC/YqgF family)